MALGKFDVPLNYKPLVGDNPRGWINNVMASYWRKRWRQVGLYTFPFPIRNIVTQTVAIEENIHHGGCEFTEEDTCSTNPLKIAHSLISKPTISKMGEEEEKLYCGVKYGPEFTDYERKAERRIARTLKKMFVKYIPNVNEQIRKNKKEFREAIRKEFKELLEEAKKTMMQEKEEEFKQKEKQLADQIKIERTKALAALKGKIEEEVKIVTQRKKDYLKDAYEFQMKLILENKEQGYLKRMNLYSSIWDKILKNLKEKAKQRIDEINRSANQFVDETALKSVKNELEEENEKTILEFWKEIQRTVRKLRAKVMIEERHINEEKCRGDRINNVVYTWDSLLKHIISLFDKLIVPVLRGKPGESSFFLTRTIAQKSNWPSQESEMSTESPSGESEKKSTISISEQEDEQNELLSRCNEKSYMTINMSLDPPDKDQIMELNLFQVKKLIEEASCAIMSKPLQIAQYMKDKSVELKPYYEETDEESSYLLNKLSGAYELIEKMLIENKRYPHVLKKPAKEVPYTIETDPEVTIRVNALIKAYRRNPEHIKALTKV